jgi:predicted phosphodiesterase
MGHLRARHLSRCSTLPLRFLRRFVPGELIRILSDIHYGDRVTRVARLSQLRPLTEGVDHLVLNGDTLDTRPGPSPAHTADCRAQVLEFFAQHAPVTTFLTGNHDADFSPHHRLDLAQSEVFVVHGDVFFENIVPWSADAPLITRMITEELRRLPARLHDDLDHRLALFRRVAAGVPQRHQSERHSLKYALRYLADTVWPPLRVLRIFSAWKLAPLRASEFVRRHRPAARFVLAGHTHRPGVWRTAGDITVINTGSFCPPLGGYAVDLGEGRLRVRRITARNREFRVADTVAEFPLALR